MRTARKRPREEEIKEEEKSLTSMNFHFMLTTPPPPPMPLPSSQSMACSAFKNNRHESGMPVEKKLKNNIQFLKERHFPLTLAFENYLKRKGEYSFLFQDLFYNRPKREALQNILSEEIQNRLAEIGKEPGGDSLINIYLMTALKVPVDPENYRRLLNVNPLIALAAFAKEAPHISQKMLEDFLVAQKGLHFIVFDNLPMMSVSMVNLIVEYVIAYGDTTATDQVREALLEKAKTSSMSSGSSPFPFFNASSSSSPSTTLSSSLSSLSSLL